MNDGQPHDCRLLDYNLFKYDVFTNEELSMIRKCAIYYRAISNEDRNYEFEISNIKQISSRDIKRFLYPLFVLTRDLF